MASISRTILRNIERRKYGRNRGGGGSNLTKAQARRLRKENQRQQKLEARQVKKEMRIAKNQTAKTQVHKKV